jgi:hypothetical protein
LGHTNTTTTTLPIALARTTTKTATTTLPIALAHTTTTTTLPIALAHTTTKTATTTLPSARAHTATTTTTLPIALAHSSTTTTASTTGLKASAVGTQPSQVEVDVDAGHSLRLVAVGRLLESIRALLLLLLLVVVIGALLVLSVLWPLLVGRVVLTLSGDVCVACTIALQTWLPAGAKPETTTTYHSTLQPLPNPALLAVRCWCYSQ